MQSPAALVLGGRVETGEFVSCCLPLSCSPRPRRANRNGFRSTASKGSRCRGKSGHFGARILSVTANGRQIRLSGAFDDKGKAGGVGAVAVSTLIFLPAGFFMTGTSAQLPVGTPVKGFIDEDVQLALAAAAPAPMVVAVPAPVVVPAKGM
jgi:hypothetical protein